MKLILSLAMGFCLTSSALGVQLVSDGTIKLQKQLTSIDKLKNGIPVIFRQIDNSDILEVIVSFRRGMKEAKLGEKTHGRMLTTVMSMATKSYPKKKLFEITEKYALSIGCSSGIESSSCRIGTLSEHWPKVLPLFEDVIENPALSEEDVELQRKRILSDVRDNIEDPGRYVNEVVNRVFYSPEHPYRQPIQASIDEIPNVKRKDLLELHKSLLNADLMTITVVGSVAKKSMMADLNKAFGDLKGGKAPSRSVASPSFNAKTAVAFEHREIPTAYIRAKFNALPINHKDEIATELMVKIFDEELSEEIRTRRSLSYAVYAYLIQYSVGVGVISASTSKPEETMLAMTQVINKMKNEKISKELLEEHKTVYATRYYLTQEEHSSLASAISGTYFYKKSIDPLYDMPRALDAVTPADIQRLAKQLLVNLRVGVVYDKKKFDHAWAKRLVDKSLTKSH